MYSEDLRNITLSSVVYGADMVPYDEQKIYEIDKYEECMTSLDHVPRCSATRQTMKKSPKDI